MNRAKESFCAIARTVDVITENILVLFPHFGFQTHNRTLSQRVNGVDAEWRVSESGVWSVSTTIERLLEAGSCFSEHLCVQALKWLQWELFNLAFFSSPDNLPSYFALISTTSKINKKSVGFCRSSQQSLTKDNWKSYKLLFGRTNENLSFFLWQKSQMKTNVPTHLRTRREFPGISYRRRVKYRHPVFSFDFPPKLSWKSFVSSTINCKTSSKQSDLTCTSAHSPRKNRMNMKSSGVWYRTTTR